MVGVLASLLQPLAEAEISVLTISTFDTDWILVPVNDAEQAAETWRRAGHEVVVATPVLPERTGAAKSADKAANKAADKSRTKPRESNDR